MIKFLQTLVFAALVFACGVVAGAYRLSPTFGLDRLLSAPRQPGASTAPLSPPEIYAARKERQMALSTRADVVMLGDSITEEGLWNELIAGAVAINRGIAGDLTFGMLERLPEALLHSPKVVSLLGGTNDLQAGFAPDVVLGNVRNIATQARQAHAAVVLTSVPYVARGYPVNINAGVERLNAGLSALSRDIGAPLVDLHAMTARDGELAPELTYDGIHLRAAAYRAWADALAPILKKLLNG